VPNVDSGRQDPGALTHTAVWPRLVSAARERAAKFVVVTVRRERDAAMARTPPVLRHAAVLVLLVRRG